MGVSKNSGTPKWMIYNGNPYKNGWFGGTPIFGNIHMGKVHFLNQNGSPFKTGNWFWTSRNGVPWCRSWSAHVYSGRHGSFTIAGETQGVDEANSKRNICGTPTVLCEFTVYGFAVYMNFSFTIWICCCHYWYMDLLLIRKSPWKNVHHFMPSRHWHCTISWVSHNETYLLKHQLFLWMRCSVSLKHFSRNQSKQNYCMWFGYVLTARTCRGCRDDGFGLLSACCCPLSWRLRTWDSRRLWRHDCDGFYVCNFLPDSWFGLVVWNDSVSCSAKSVWGG